MEHVVSSNAPTWPLIIDELTAVHVLQPDDVSNQPKQPIPPTQTPSKVGQCDINGLVLPIRDQALGQPHCALPFLESSGLYLRTFCYRNMLACHDA